MSYVALHYFHLVALHYFHLVASHYFPLCCLAFVHGLLSRGPILRCELLLKLQFFCQYATKNLSRSHHSSFVMIAENIKIAMIVNFEGVKKRFITTQWVLPI